MQKIGSKRAGLEVAMQITELKMKEMVDEGAMKAITSVTFDDQLVIHDIKVIYAHDKYFVVMPSRKTSDGSFRDITHPITPAFRKYVETTVLDAYWKMVKELESKREDPFSDPTSEEKTEE